MIIVVRKITPIALGNEIRRRFGEDDSTINNEQEKTTLKFIKAAISFIPEAKDAGTDFTNAAFIFAQPRREFVIKAGKGDWEFYFSEEADGKICGKCVRTGSIWRYLWNGAGKFIHVAVKALSIIGPAGLKALMSA